MKILWMAGSALEGRYDARIARKMKDKYGFDFELITFMDRTAQAVRADGTPCVTIKELLARTDFSGMSDEETIGKANDLLKFLDVKMLVHGDYLLLFVSDKQKGLVYAARVVIAMAKYMSEGGFGCCLRYGSGGIVSRAMCYLAGAMGIKSYDLLQGTWYGTSDLMYNDRANEKWIWLSFMPFWEKVKDQTVPDDEKRRIDEYVSEYYSSHIKKTQSPVLNVLGNKSCRFFTSSYLKEKIKDVIRFFRPAPEPRHLDPLVEGNMDGFSDEWGKLYVKWERDWLKTCHGFKYDPLPKKFVYMPLIFKWDLNYIVWNTFNYMQEFMVRVANESLPAGYELVVKEHPYFPGLTSHNELREYQKEGIKVVDPRTDGLDLVKSAQAIFSLNETTGWEAVMFKTPAVVVGSPPYYSIHPAIRVVSNINEMPDALMHTLKNRDSAFADSELWYRVMKTSLFSTTPANIWAYKTTKFWAEKDESDKNVELLADMIFRVGKLGEIK